MKRVLINNSIFGLGQASINLLLVFFTIPLFIKLLGTESYGVFSLILVIGSLSTLTNLGLTNALLKFIAEQGRTKESNIDIIVALLIVLTLVFPITIVTVYFNKFILINILKIPKQQFYLAQPFFKWVVFANALLLIGQIFKAVLDGLQKIHITSVLGSIYNMVYWGLIISVLLLGYNLPEVGFAVFLAAFIWLTTIIYMTFKVWGRLSLEGINLYFKLSAKKQLTYGLKVYSSGMIGFFYEPLSKILISNFIGVSAVGFYDIAVRLKNQLWSFVSAILHPLFPFIASQNDKTLIHKYINDIQQKIFLVVTPITVLVVLLTDTFITLWIGSDTDTDIISITVIPLVSFFLLFSVPVVPIYQYLMAKDLVGKTIIIQLFNVIFNALFFILLVNHIGYYALIIGNAAALLSSFLVSLYYQNKYLNSFIFNSFGQVSKLLLSFTILILTGFLMKKIFSEHEVLNFVITPLVLISITLLCYNKLRLVKHEDIYRYFGTKNKFSLILVKIFNS